MNVSNEIKEQIKTKINETIGEASMCWTPRPSNEVFNSNEASKISDDLYTFIMDKIENIPTPTFRWK